MELLAAGWLMLGTACVTLALVHATVWLRGDRGFSHVWIAVASFAAAGNAFTELWMSRAETVGEFSSAFEWSNRFIALTERSGTDPGEAKIGRCREQLGRIGYEQR